MWRCKKGTESVCSTAGELKKALANVPDDMPIDDPLEVGVYVHDDTKEKMLIIHEA